MSRILIVLVLLFSTSGFAFTTLDAVKSTAHDLFVVKITDYGNLPPFDAQNLFNSIRMENPYWKSINEAGFKLDCQSKTILGQVMANCIIDLDLSSIKLEKGYYLFRVKGIDAQKLFAHFKNINYVSILGNSAYVSMLTSRQEFIFGIKANLVD